MARGLDLDTMVSFSTPLILALSLCFFAISKSLLTCCTEGRWLISIQLSTSYPLAPPKMRFVTQIIHPNIALQTGEICLDLLKDKWTPTYSVLQCVRAVRMLLGYPETDSPLNVDVAALLRGGDVVGTRKLVQYWCSEPEGRYDGP